MMFWNIFQNQTYLSIQACICKMLQYHSQSRPDISAEVLNFKEALRRPATARCQLALTLLCELSYDRQLVYVLPDPSPFGKSQCCNGPLRTNLTLQTDADCNCYRVRACTRQKRLSASRCPKLAF